MAGLDDFMTGWQSVAAPHLYAQKQARAAAEQEARDAAHLAQIAPTIFEPLRAHVTEPGQIDIINAMEASLKSGNPELIKEVFKQIGRYQDNAMENYKSTSNMKDFRFLQGMGEEGASIATPRFFADSINRPGTVIQMGGDKPIDSSFIPKIKDPYGRPAKIPIVNGQPNWSNLQPGSYVQEPEKPLKDPNPSHVSVYMKNSEHLKTLLKAKEMVEKYPDAFGPTNVVGKAPLVGQTLNKYRDEFAGVKPEDRKKWLEARAAVGSIGSTARHELSGATVTVGENGQLLWSVQDPTDYAENLLAKINNEISKTQATNDEIKSYYSNGDFKPIDRSDTPPSEPYNGTNPDGTNALQTRINARGYTEIFDPQSNQWVEDAESGPVVAPDPALPPIENGPGKPRYGKYKPRWPKKSEPAPAPPANDGWSIEPAE